MAPFDDRIRAETYELLPKTSLSSEKPGRDYDHEDALSSTKSHPGLAWEHPLPIGWPPRPDCLAFPRRWWSGDGYKTYKYRPSSSYLDEESISWGRVPFRGASRRLFHFVVPSDRRCTPRLVLWGLCKIVLGFLGVCVFMIVFTGVFLPSYARLPEHYQALERICLNSKRAGRGNIHGEKVFIAATLNDPHGSIVGGQWGSAVKELVDLLGPENVHLSVYENDPDHQAREALESLGGQLSCNTSLVMNHMSHDELPRVSLPDGEKRIKRIAFLSEVRNRALRPLQTNSSTKFDKLLYLNDVAFNPIDALHLLFSTNLDATGNAQYSAACAVDFMNPFKFYDRYASRDFEGHETGLPFYPWFTTAGKGQSRQDVLDQSDAVRVRSCWGGMVAFDASPFQNNIENLSSSTTLAKPSEEIEASPLRFRYETDPFWDASECCLVHADLTYLRYGLNTSISTGILMNPYVRVAYDPYTLSWLPYTRRIESLYPLIHNILNHALHMPAFNPRSWEQPGDRVLEKLWDIESASWKMVKKTIGPGRFCGRRSISVLNEFAGEGEKAFVTLPPPPGL